jgi:hypothetical protein
VNGSTIYAGGSFTTIDGQTRHHIAALDAGSGHATTWNPDADNAVYALAVSGSTVYAGGTFFTINGQSRSRIAALDASTGFATAWNPNPNSSISTLVVAPPISGAESPTSGMAPGNMVYAGGSFVTIGGQTRAGIAALRDGAATCQSAASGGSWQASNWNNCGGGAPSDGDSVSIQTGHAITLYGRLAVNNLTINAGGELSLPLGSPLTAEGGLTNNGRLTQVLAVPTTTTTTFLNIKNAAGVSQYFGLAITPSGDMGNTTVTVRGNQNCAIHPGDVLVQRCFEIASNTPRIATVRFYYNSAELNGKTYNLLKLWRQNFGWLQVGATPYSYSTTCNAGQLNCWLEAQNISIYSLFVLGSRVHSVTLAPLVRR